MQDCAVEAHLQTAPLVFLSSDTANHLAVGNGDLVYVINVIGGLHCYAILFDVFPFYSLHSAQLAVSIAGLDVKAFICNCM